MCPKWGAFLWPYIPYVDQSWWTPYVPLGRAKLCRAWVVPKIRRWGGEGMQLGGCCLTKLHRNCFTSCVRGVELEGKNSLDRKNKFFLLRWSWLQVSYCFLGLCQSMYCVDETHQGAVWSIQAFSRGLGGCYRSVATAMVRTSDASSAKSSHNHIDKHAHTYVYNTVYIFIYTYLCIHI